MAVIQLNAQTNLINGLKATTAKNVSTTWSKGLAPTILELSAYANYNDMQSLVPLKATKVKKKKVSEVKTIMLQTGEK